MTFTANAEGILVPPGSHKPSHDEVAESDLSSKEQASYTW